MSRARLGDFISAASFWRPEFVDPTSFWLEHAPFSFWLVKALRPSVVVELGTYSGFSYLSFCQAIAKLELPSRAFAVDTWKGDQHMGEYGGDILAELSEYHDQRYAAFSRLVPSTFDDAVSHFEDASIDLLHIDGVHTYEAVRHDFETWAPKLSGHGVLVFHDTNVREQSFGVHRLWAELRDTHRGFEFVHGQGLGVLELGDSVPNPVAALFDTEADQTLTAEIRAAYTHLGKAISQPVVVRSDRDRLGAEVAKLETARSDVEAQVQTLAAALDDASAERERLLAALSETETQRDRHAESARALGAEVASSQSRLANANLEVAQLRAEFESVIRSESWRVTVPLRAVTFRLRRLVNRARRTARLRTRVRRLRGRRASSDADIGAQALTDFAPPGPLDELLKATSRGGSLIEFDDETTDLPQGIRDEAIVRSADSWKAQRQTRSARVHPTTRPLISVLVPTFNTDPGLLGLAIDSVLRQTYPNWELVIVDDGSTSETLRRVLDSVESRDPRIRVTRNPVNEGISRATNRALELASGEFVALLDHDDELLPDALLEVVLRINCKPDLDVIYTDQQYVDLDGRPSGLLLKPDWSPTLFCGVMFVGHLLVVRRTVAEAIGGFDPAFDNVQDFEFMLRVSEQTRRIAHVPRVLYHWRRVPGGVAFHGDEKAGINELQAQAVTAHFGRRGIAARARPNARHAHRAELVVGKTNASVLVALWPSTDDAALHETLRGLVRSGSNVTGVIVADETRTGLEPFAADLPLTIGHGGLPRALSEADADFILSLEPGLVPDSSDWLAHLVFHARDDVAAVTSVIVDSRGRVEESGLVLGLNGAFGPAMSGLDRADDGYAGSLSCSREVSAVSGRCALISRENLARLAGEENPFRGPLASWVDLSLRARRDGMRNIVSSQSVARRVAASRSLEKPLDPIDEALLHDRWTTEFGSPDPYYNPNFRRTGSGYDLAA